MRPTCLSMPKTRLTSLFRKRNPAPKTLSSAPAPDGFPFPVQSVNAPVTPPASESSGEAAMGDTPELDDSDGAGRSSSSIWVLGTPKGDAGAETSSPASDERTGFDWVGSSVEGEGSGLWLGEPADHIDEAADALSPLNSEIDNDWLAISAPLMSPVAICDSPLPMSPVTTKPTFARRASDGLQERSGKLRKAHRTLPMGFKVKPVALSEEEEAALEAAKEGLEAASDELKARRDRAQQLASLVSREGGRATAPTHAMEIELVHSSAAYMQCHTSNVALQSEYVQAVASYDEGVSLASFWRGRVRESEAKRDGLGFKRGRRTAAEQEVKARWRQTTKELRQQARPQGGVYARCASWTVGKCIAAKDGCRRLVSGPAKRAATSNSDGEGKEGNAERAGGGLVTVATASEGSEAADGEADQWAATVEIVDERIDARGGISYCFAQYEAQQGQTLVADVRAAVLELCSASVRKLTRSYLSACLAMTLLALECLASLSISLRVRGQQYRRACAAMTAMVVLTVASWRFAVLVVSLAILGQIIAIPRHDRVAGETAVRAGIAFALFAVSAPDPLYMFVCLFVLVNTHLGWTLMRTVRAKGWRL